MTPPPIRVDVARPADRAGILAVVRRAWRDDYVPGVLDEWLRDPGGPLVVARLDGRIVGSAKLTMLGDREAWLHGLRVDPDHRRRGVARALLDERVARARGLGATVARLDTSSDNAAVHRLMRRAGFRRVGRFTTFARRARRGTPTPRATPAQLRALWRVCREGDGLIHGDWTQRRMRRSDLEDAIRAGSCYVGTAARGGLALALVEDRGDARLRVRYVAGKGPAFADLLRALPSAAAAEGTTEVRIPLAPRSWPAARRAGYRRLWDDAMDVFERRL